MSGNYQVATLADLLERGFQRDDIYAQLDAIYAEFPAPEAVGNEYGDPRMWNRIMDQNPTCIHCLTHDVPGGIENIVAYWFAIPIIKSVYYAAISGKNINSTITDRDVDQFDVPGEYYLYFVDLFRRRNNNNVTANRAIVDSFCLFLTNLVRFGYVIKKIVANISEVEAERISQKIGFEYVRDHACHKMYDNDRLVPTKIYELDLASGVENYSRMLTRQYLRDATDTYADGSSAERIKYVEEKIGLGEGEGIEFKSTMRMNVSTGVEDDRIKVAVLKTICAYLNTRGGDLLIGVGPDDTVIGTSNDRFKSNDEMLRTMTGLVNTRIGHVFLPFVHPVAVTIGENCVLLVRCETGPKPAFVTDQSKRKFFVRTGAQTEEMTGEDMLAYIDSRFRRTDRF